jgi:hypothetical protein
MLLLLNSSVPAYRSRSHGAAHSLLPKSCVAPCTVVLTKRCHCTRMSNEFSRGCMQNNATPKRKRRPNGYNGIQITNQASTSGSNSTGHCFPASARGLPPDNLGGLCKAIERCHATDSKQFGGRSYSRSEKDSQRYVAITIETGHAIGSRDKRATLQDSERTVPDRLYLYASWR